MLIKRNKFALYLYNKIWTFDSFSNHREFFFKVLILLTVFELLKVDVNPKVNIQSFGKEHGDNKIYTDE